MKNFLLKSSLILIAWSAPVNCLDHFEREESVHSEKPPTGDLFLHPLVEDGISLSDAQPKDMFYISTPTLLEAQSDALLGYSVSIEMTKSTGKIGAPFAFRESSGGALIEFSLAVDQKSTGWQPLPPRTTYFQGENIIFLTRQNPFPQRKLLHFVAEKGAMTTPGVYYADLTAVLTDNR